MQALWDILAENWRDLLAGTWLTVQLVAIAASSASSSPCRWRSPACRATAP